MRERFRKQPCVYILVSRAYGTLYVGVTSNLATRMTQHVQELFDGYTKKYRIKILVYYEMHDTMEKAIRREKRLKKWNREWKYRLIEQMNPEWKNLFNRDTGEILFGPADLWHLIDGKMPDIRTDARLHGRDGRVCSNDTDERHRSASLTHKRHPRRL